MNLFSKVQSQTTRSRRGSKRVRLSGERLEPRRLLAAFSDAEQLVVELINRARADPAAEATRLGIELNQGLSPGTIAAGSKPPLAINAALHDAALAHGQDMDSRQFFDHTNPDGEGPTDRARQAGYEHGVGENLALNAAREDDAATATVMHDQLFLSPGHRANMMTGWYAEIGVGLHQEPATGSFFRSAWLTEKFGARSDTFLTGVAFDDADGDDFYSVGEGLGGVRVTANGSNGSFSTTTGSSGGYSLPLEDGDYDVVVSGGELGDRVVRYQVTVDGQNVKLDVRPETDATPRLIRPERILGQHQFAADDRPTAILVRAETDTRLTLRREDGGPTLNLQILDESLTEIQQTDNDATTATFTAGHDYVLVFPAADIANIYTITSDAGAGSLSTHVATNRLVPTDTNGNGDTTPSDALAVLNTLRRIASTGDDTDAGTAATALMDANADGRVSPLDALAVLNHLRRRSAAEGESVDAPSSTTHQPIAMIEEPKRMGPKLLLETLSLLK
ncbi:MAG: CAP domain-containing protein [Planctomycetota bacterium]